jgi:hypothetical protein
VIAAAGARTHLTHPLGVKAFEYRRVKNDVRDADDLADLLRMGPASGPAGLQSDPVGMGEPKHIERVIAQVTHSRP